MKTIAFLILASVALAIAMDKIQARQVVESLEARIDVICDVCVVIVEDLDEFITEDTTEQEIIDFAKNLCKPFGWIGDSFELLCDIYLQANLPTIIENIVENQLSPEHICTDILGLCEAPGNATVTLL